MSSPLWKEFEELVREVEASDLPVESMLRFGRPADEIVKAVAEAGLDMLVMGSHGHRGIGDVVLHLTDCLLNPTPYNGALCARVPREIDHDRRQAQEGHQGVLGL